MKGGTMARRVLDEKMWLKLQKLLPARTSGGRPSDDRRFIEAVCWILRTGAPWRDLPPEYGPWKTAYNRFNRWSKQGHIDEILRELKKRWRSRMADD